MTLEVEKGEVALPLRGVGNGYESSPPQEGRKFKQYLAAIAANLGALTVGTILSWTSPALPMLKSNATMILDQPLTEDEGGWVGSLIAVGALIGTFPTGFLCDKIGRRWTIIGLGLPFIISWIMIVFATNVGVLYAARIFAGIATGGSSIAIPMYVGEIAESSVRGALGSFFQLLLTIGILFSYLVGTIVDYKVLGILSGIIPVVFMVAFFFMPESPTYLLKQNKSGEARKALEMLRGPEYDVDREISNIKEELDAANQNKASIKDLFSSRANVNALIIGLSLMLFQQLSGVNAVIFYTADIFKASGSSLDENVCSIIVGVVQVVMTYVATLLVDRAGRRILLLISSVVMCTCLAVLGLFFHLKNGDPSSVSNISWLPLLCVTLFIVTFSLGFGPLPWMMMSEIFSSSIKSAAAGIAVTLNWTLTFIVTKTFTDLVASIGQPGAFWLFASITGVGVLFVFFRVPETKGKTIVEIQRELGGK